jgi:hypothetical protein
MTAATRRRCTPAPVSLTTRIVNIDRRVEVCTAIRRPPVIAASFCSRRGRDRPPPPRRRRRWSPRCSPALSTRRAGGRLADGGVDGRRPRCLRCRCRPRRHCCRHRAGAGRAAVARRAATTTAARAGRAAARAGRAGLAGVAATSTAAQSRKRQRPDSSPIVNTPRNFINMRASNTHDVSRTFPWRQISMILRRATATDFPATARAPDRTKSGRSPSRRSAAP